MDAHDWDERYAAHDLVWSAGPNQFVEAALADLSPGSALDLAAGEGRNALWLAARGWDVTAVDFSSVGLDKARALEERQPREAHAVHWVHADVLDYRAPAAVDLALLAYLQVPDEQRHRAVRRVFADLRVGGTFFLVAHDTTNLAEGTGGPPDPAVLYTSEDVLTDLDGERYEVHRAERVPRHVTAEDGTQRTAYDALVHLTRTA